MNARAMPPLKNLSRSADEAGAFLKALANPQRLRIVCLIAERERPVGELAEAAKLKQSAVSQHLALLRREGLLSARRQGKAVYYQLTDRNVASFLSLLQAKFCRPE